MSSNQRSFTKNNKLTNQEKMLKGSAWMTASNIISRLLGAVYIIPWYAWMGSHGDEANSLFSMGYTVYSLFLLISTAGIPAAIAKQTSYYNSLNEYKLSRQLFRRALQLMAVLGVIFSIFMYLCSPMLAKWSGGGEELVPAMRSLSWAVLIFPCMSILRGYFQGNQNMMPYALSQIVEQVARVFYMLLSAFIIMKVMNGDYVSAVTQATFAAFIGMLASLFVLLFYMRKQKPMLDYLEKHSANQYKASTADLLVETLRQAIPFILVGSGVTVFKLVDQFTFSNIMKSFTDYSDSQLRTLFAIFNANPDKLTMVVIALATSISATSLPLITEAITLKKYNELSKLVSNNLQMFFFVMLPSTFGMIVLARPLYAMFYSPDDLGVSVLIQACYAGLFMGFYMLSSTILMGMYENRAAMRYFGFGLLLKMVVQYPCILLFEVYGPLLATMIGFALSCLLIIRKIKRVGKINFTLTVRRSLLMLTITLMMTILTMLFREFLYLFLDPSRKFQSFLIVLLVAVVGAIFYGYTALKLRLADQLFGDRIAKVRHKLKIK